MRPRFALIFALAMSAPTLASAKPRGLAGGSPSGARLEADARAAVKRGDSNAAATMLRVARESDADVPAALVLLHAQIYAKLNDRTRATRAYQDFLRIAGTTASMKERGEAVARIQDYSSEVGSLIVKVRPEGARARVVVDGEIVGTAPLAQTVPVAPGTHVVSLQGSNLKKTVKVKSEESATVELEGPAVAIAAAPTSKPAPAPAAPAPVVVAAPAPAPPPPSPSPTNPNTRPDLDVPPSENALIASDEPKPEPKLITEEAPSRSESASNEGKPRSSAWIGWTAAGALAAGAIASGIASSSAIHDYEAKKETLGTTRDELESEQGRAKLFAGISAGLGVAAIATAAVTFLVSRNKEAAPAITAPSANLRVSTGFVGVGGVFR